MRVCMLSTKDNPFNPFDDYTSWLSYDIEKGHNTNGRLMREAHISDQLTDKENEEEIERAIDEIIKYDLEKKFEKIVRDEEFSTSKATADT